MTIHLSDGRKLWSAVELFTVPTWMQAIPLAVRPDWGHGAHPTPVSGMDSLAKQLEMSCTLRSKDQVAMEEAERQQPSTSWHMPAKGTDVTARVSFNAATRRAYLHPRSHPLYETTAGNKGMTLNGIRQTLAVLRSSLNPTKSANQ